MAAELVLDASVSLAWFLKESPERAAYAAAVSAAAADGTILHVPVQWGLATLDHGHRQAARAHNVALFSVA
ncbi:MAG: hypothetical protein ABI654_09595 [Betaproteobacteria bacterium]